MKIIVLAILVSMVSSLTIYSQNLHNSANAASIENETNATTGWTGTATISSDNTTAQDGVYSLHFAVQGQGREARYTFNATPGAVYNISIWARRSPDSNNPAFANWLGVTGFTTTVINSQNWTQYNFTVTATAVDPVIRVYAGPIGAANGVDVFIDAVSIFPEVPLDTEAPSVPAGLAVSNITENSALISWDASTDNVGVVSYSILQNGSAVGSVNGNTLQYQANNLTPETAYAFTVTASDAAGNTSLPGTPVEFSTLPPPVDSIAPSVPVGLTTSNVTSSGLTLMWSASTDNVGVTNYLIYRDSLPPVSTGSNSTSYQFTELSPLTEYSFRVAASDAVGNTSQLSEPLLVTTLDVSGVIAWTSNNANLPTVDWQANNMFAAGVAGIGTAPNPDFRLSVNGAIRAKEIIVETGWSDFVFEPGYYLAPLNEVESFIKLNGHLKDIPSEAHVKANGVGLAEINTLLLQKIEELTLYIIELNKRLTAIESNDK